MVFTLAKCDAALTAKINTTWQYVCLWVCVRVCVYVCVAIMCAWKRVNNSRKHTASTLWVITWANESNRVETSLVCACIWHTCLANRLTDWLIDRLADWQTDQADPWQISAYKSRYLTPPLLLLLLLQLPPLLFGQIGHT